MNSTWKENGKRIWSAFSRNRLDRGKISGYKGGSKAKAQEKTIK